MDNNETRLSDDKPDSRSDETAVNDETRLSDQRPPEPSAEAAARTQARETQLRHERKAQSTVTLGRAKNVDTDPDATKVSSDSTHIVGADATVVASEVDEDNTRTLPRSSGLAPTAISDPNIPQKIIRRDSTFAHLEHRIATEFVGKKVLKKRFVLVKTLGSGGMGNVYLAKDLLREEMDDSDNEIAIKVLNDECRNLPGALQSLQREAKKAQALSHPNIVTVYDFDRHGETAFITMEYINGEELKDHLRKNRKMPHAKAMYVIERIARGLAYAHQQGFAHADIKPANIFLGENGVVKILDFGIAKAFTEATKEKKRSLADDLTEGALTPSYASLEMLKGQQALPGDDVYSLSCMAYEMLVGRHPFIGEDGLPTPADVAQANGMKVEPIPGIPRRHMRALRRGLEFEREKRFKDAGEFIDAIRVRNWKKDLAMLGSAATVTGVIIFAVNQGLDQVVPSVDSLKPELAQVVEAIKEADGLLEAGDVEFAHRLYSHAWEVASDLTANDVDEREKAQMILQDRLKKISQDLIEKSQQKNVDEFHLRELRVALEFLLQDDIGGNEKRIKRALDDIDKKLKKLAN